MGDASAALIHNGQLIAAAEEERFSRNKHHSGFPYHALRYCLDEAGITMAEVDHVALYWKPWILWRKAGLTLAALLRSRDMFAARLDRGATQIVQEYLGMLRLPRLLRKEFGNSRFKFHYLEHHLCHAASAFYVSPFERAAILTMDGTGEETTTMMASGTDTEIQPLDRIKLPHSLGQFYSAITNYLGFDMQAGDEWKIMGLAAYGKPEYYDFLARRVLRSDRHGTFRFNIGLLDHHLAKQYKFGPEVIAELGPPRHRSEEITERHMNIAASAQLILEETVLRLVRRLHEMTRIDYLCLAGGVALNSVMNGRIIQESPFKEVFVQPAAGDAGCSLGAAHAVYHNVLRKARTFQMKHAYYGPSFSSETCASALRAAGLSFETLPDEVLLPRVARLIADGAIVGWFQGRMEFGPRALGNRSFLADPRGTNTRQLLNEKVKLREWFRPLAPSMLEESSCSIFGRPYHDPFMITVLQVLEEQRESIPAVVHVDGTARPQTVSKETNPRFWRLIREFEHLTDVPVLLNTSFNIQEPIVCSPENAIRTFQQGSFEALVLENHLVLRRSITH